ncbi:MAG: AAA family ATPase [Nitriliruptorales bacterium]|nr:AAA family ATPase [Nitriliruptorales bacterium]
MTYRVLFGLPDAAQASEAVALAEESGECTVLDAVTTAGAILEGLTDRQVDAVCLHERLGPLPVLDLAREIATRFPDIAVVLMAREQSQGLLRGALQSGVRGVVTLPLSLEDLQATVASAAAWAQAVRARLTAEDTEDQLEGRVLAVAGAKGGVGATTIAVRLALEAQTASRHRRVCLIDFDLQAGDVRGLLDLTHRRSIADLVEVAEELTARQLDESLYLYPTGLRILLPPPDGEHGEYINGYVARRVLGAIRSRFDVVVVDVGSYVTEAAAMAAEIADQVVVVTTPDVAALRAANRLIALWERLQIRKDGIGVVVNRASKDSEVQADLVRRVVDATVLKAAIPADFRALEAATNTGKPARLADGPVRRGLTGLAAELHLIAPRERARRGRWRSQRGSVAAETMGLAFTIGVVVLLLWQAVLAGFTFVLASHAAREGARELAVGAATEQIEAAAAASLPPAWLDSMRLDPGSADVTVQLAVPLIVPGRFLTPIDVSARAGTVVEQANARPPAIAGGIG